MSDLASEVGAIVDRETRAWDTQDAELLLSVFHPDMVWPWPKSPTSHDPMGWVLEWGRYDRQKWLSGCQKLFDAHELVRKTSGRLKRSRFPNLHRRTRERPTRTIHPKLSGEPRRVGANSASEPGG